MIGMKYLVTGATAFAGCHLVRHLLANGCEVFATSRRTNGSEVDVLDLLPEAEFREINWVFCDLTNRSSCFKAVGAEKYDGIFHLAAQSHPPTGFSMPFYTFDVNIQGTLNLLEAVSEIQPETHLMFCSTSEVYGNPRLAPGQVMDETFPMAPINPYACSKAAVDLICQERFTNGYLNGFITRAFSHTGPKRGRIFSISSDAYQIANILSNHQPPIIKIGNLKTRRAVMDVRDCVHAYYLLMRQKATGVYNVGGETVHEMGFFLQTLLNIAGLEDSVELQVEPAFLRKVDIQVQKPDSGKLKAATQWKCAIPIEQTLSDLLEYWKAKTAISASEAEKKD